MESCSLRAFYLKALVKPGQQTSKLSYGQEMRERWWFHLLNSLLKYLENRVKLKKPLSQIENAFVNI